MTRIHRGHPSSVSPNELQRRLRAEADRRGDADGTAERGELQQLVRDLEAHGPDRFDAAAAARLSEARALASASGEEVATLSAQLRGAPPALRRLALEVDALWGNADGQVGVDELERVAAHYLAALPFFGARAETLVELARYLGTAGLARDAVAPSVVALRSALARLDPDEAAAGRPFGDLFEQARPRATSRAPPATCATPPCTARAGTA